VPTQLVVRATRAYIASMGTAAVMLGASLSLFAFVGTLVSFGAWPGLGSHENVDSLLVESVTTKTSEPLRIDPRPRQASTGERVRDAVRQLAQAPGSADTAPAAPVTRLPSGPAPTPAPAPGPTGDGGNAPGPTTEPVQRPLERTANELGRTVDIVTQQTGEIVNQIGQQVQGPLTQADGTLRGALR